jgi:hypothetical protein
MTSQLINTEYSTIRGFNYQPSYAPNGYGIWRKLNCELIDQEIGRGVHFFPKINTLRIWLSFDAYVLNPKQFCQDFDLYLQVLDKYHLKAIPTLFNNWHSIPDFGGISEEIIKSFWRDIGKKGTASDSVFRLYLENLVGDHKSDDRILVWDLCNEPENNGSLKLMMEWLQHTYNFCKQLKVVQTIGVSIQPDVLMMKNFDSMSDVFLLHPYFADKKKWDLIIGFANKRKKGIIATECCWGSLDDEKRSQIISIDLQTLSKYKIGFLPHMMHESLVADGHHPEFGPMCKTVEYMAFINMDGTLRKGHQIFNQF